MRVLPREFFERPDVVQIAKELLGKWIFTLFDGELTGGMIIETEAYKGAEDRACHAFNNRKTKRTKVMFETGGVAYVYLCYGMHHLFNIVTNKKEIPHAILLRSIIPDHGIDIMQKRRNGKKNIATGPGMVCQALGIDRSHNGLLLDRKPLWLEDRGENVSVNQIQASKRIGVEYAKEHADLPWRFYITCDCNPLSSQKKIF